MNDDILTVPHNLKRMREGFILTERTGSWMYMPKEKYSRFLQDKMDNRQIKNMLQAGLLIDKNTAKRKVLENAKRKHFVFNGPTLHIIIPTARCNQGCSYCHSSVKPPSVFIHKK